MGQIEQTVCKQMSDVKLWMLYCNKPHLRMLSTKCIYESYTYSILMYKLDLASNNQQRLLLYKTKRNGTKSS